MSPSPTLDWQAAALQQRLARLCPGIYVEVAASLGSTNSTLLDRLREQGPDSLPCLLVAEQQTAGRGRMGREWLASPGSSLTFSIGLSLAVQDWSGLSLALGCAIANALEPAGSPPRLQLKWPNDIVIAGPSRDGGPGPRKLGGLLLERVVGEHPADSGAAVVGIGINVDLREDELPVPTATSTFLEGVAVRREPLAVDVLGHLRLLLMSWQQAEGDAELSGVASTYREVCLTLGEQVRVTRPPGDDLLGVASAIDSAGRLIVTDGDGLSTTVAAGDVHHVRSR